MLLVLMLARPEESAERPCEKKTQAHSRAPCGRRVACSGRERARAIIRLWSGGVPSLTPPAPLDQGSLLLYSATLAAQPNQPLRILVSRLYRKHPANQLRPPRSLPVPSTSPPPLGATCPALNVISTSMRPSLPLFRSQRVSPTLLVP